MTERFADRHLGPREHELQPMLRTCGCGSLQELIGQTIPDDIRLREPLELPPAASEHEALAELRRIAEKNTVARSLIGMGYHAAITPAVLRRNILEHPGWYTAYTPYQAEIAQGRLEALLIFQTMVSELTALPVANASLLDEATAAAEAMTMARRVRKGRGRRFFVADDCHPQTIAVVHTRAAPLGIEVVVGPSDTVPLDDEELFGLLVQYPATDGTIRDYEALCRGAAERGVVPVIATDLLSLTLLRPPGEFGAQIVVGGTQRFGLPMWYGGPHAAFLATVQQYVRQVPGRIVGVSRDARGMPALRLAIQTREQHIRREKATSNICTAQVLPAVVAAMYAVWHGPEGLRRIATRIASLTATLREGLRQLGCEVTPDPAFDTLRIRPTDESGAVAARARQRLINLRDYGDGTLGVSLDERSTADEVATLLEIFGAEPQQATQLARRTIEPTYPDPLRRTSCYLSDPVFSRYHSETDMMRYLHRLADRDVALNRSMIPLGSCTMKLNAAAEMLPVTWPELAELHPFAPADQATGYRELFEQLGSMLRRITGLPVVSLQPNAGAQGEYTGLLAIRAYHAARGEPQRNVCLIPTSAHGTNPASAVLAGCKVVPVACDERGDIDVSDLRARASEHAERLAALMITYPSTHGVFEESVREICAIVHEFGGQVYMDGANMNAQCGLTRPAHIGADVVHLNLHKTFAIPHGGGGPGVGPIAVAEHLAPFLPRHPLDPWAADRTSQALTNHPSRNIGPPCPMRPSASGREASGTEARRYSDDAGFCPQESVGPVAAAPWGSPGVLCISWMYIRMMGAEGLRRASEVAILNANYMAARLAEHYPVLYTNRRGRVGHEFILDLRPLKKSAGIEPDDVAKRLMDFGFHAPTMSFPVPGTLMIEPTESEPKDELDRFCDAMIAIREEIRRIEQGAWPRDDNPLKRAPHTAADLVEEPWQRPYSREQAVFPAPWVHERKYWPPVGRIDNPWGDRHLFCSCAGIEEVAAAGA